jgi:hypothetical protein
MDFSFVLTYGPRGTSVSPVGLFYSLFLTDFYFCFITTLEPAGGEHRHPFRERQGLLPSPVTGLRWYQELLMVRETVIRRASTVKNIARTGKTNMVERDTNMFRSSGGKN